MLGFVADTVIMFTTQLLFFIFGYLFFMLQLFSNYEVRTFQSNPDPYLPCLFYTILIFKVIISSRKKDY
jgi:hypothetical protein